MQRRRLRLVWLAILLAHLPAFIFAAPCHFQDLLDAPTEFVSYENVKKASDTLDLPRLKLLPGQLSRTAYFVDAGSQSQKTIKVTVTADGKATYEVLEDIPAVINKGWESGERPPGDIDPAEMKTFARELAARIPGSKEEKKDVYDPGYFGLSSSHSRVHQGASKRAERGRF